MSALGIALLVALGAGAWIYAKVLRSTGNNQSSALITAGASAALIALLVWMLLGLIPG